MPHKDPAARSAYMKAYAERRRQEAPPFAAELLRTLFIYDPSSGVLVWAKSGPNRRKGEIAGGFDKDGYRRVGVFSRQILASHIIWILVHGRLPDGDIDHRDLNRSNDRLDNLREADRRSNIANTNLRCTNTSGFKGVYFNRQNGKWRARIRDHYKHIHLGDFDAPEEAGEAYRQAAVLMYGEFARVV